MTHAAPTDEAAAPRFLVDGMLGNVARDLRLLGYDAIFGEQLPDPELLHLAQNQGRVLLTRDRALARRARDLPCVLLTENAPRRQVLEVLSSLGLGPSPAGPFSRCLACNGRLVELPAEDAASAVPDHVTVTAHNFLGCRDCGRVYWPGTHRTRLQERVREVLGALLPPRGPV
ncbi:MAG: Mut7-C RNAse domain-containing protein [Deltaproteobacteria bacterium]|nr:Mut7-C RNAse domain-containing protein [Deltaproteobacteria bacterium]